MVIKWMDFGSINRNNFVMFISEVMAFIFKTYVNYDF